MGRKVSWRLSVILLLAGAGPISASTNPARSVGRTRCRKDATNSLIGRALADQGRRLLPSLLADSNPCLLASSVTTRRSHHANPYSTDDTLYHETRPVSAVVQQVATLPTALWSKIKEQPHVLWSKLKESRPPKNAGYYYGLIPDNIFPYDSSQHRAAEIEKTQQLAMADTLSETLEEMRNMRKELQTMRREMYEMRKKITGEIDLEFEGSEQEEEVDPEIARLAKQKRQRQFDRLGREVEKWARQKLFEEDRAGNGWTEVPCNKMIGKTVNPDGRTTCYVNWLPDTRGKNAFKDDTRAYPCLKVYGLIDAPVEDVCTYLSRKEHMTDYNDVLDEQRDLEEIAPHSKICLATTPQVLFVKPREFVTFVYHRWLNDGTCVMINQAVEHKDAPPVKEEGKGKACRGYALRGATFLSPDPNDPEKTRMAFIAHAASGGNLPQWAVKTAIGAVAPIEPYKLFHKIGENVKNSKPELEKLKRERSEQASVPGRSNQPVGLAQIGFACFWPNGGGLMSGKPPPAAGVKADNKAPTVETKEVETPKKLPAGVDADNKAPAVETKEVETPKKA